MYDAENFEFKFSLVRRYLKGRRKQGNIAVEAKMRPGGKNVFGKFQNHCLLLIRRFCVFNICCVGEQTRNHLGNTEETLTLNVSRMFPRLRPQATCLEDTEFASRKQKCFASFPFAHPYNIVSNINSKCFCSNVSSFAPTLRDLQLIAVPYFPLVSTLLPASHKSLLFIVNHLEILI